MKYVILGAPMSPFVRKVRVFCAEKGIDYDLEMVSPFNPPEGWTDISPLGRIPVLALVDDDGSRRYLPDSSVICAFLEQMHPEPNLIPTDPIARGSVLWLEEYADSDLAAAIGLGIFRPVALAGMSGGDPDLVKARDTIDNVLPKFLDYLEAQIGDKEFLVEDRLTLADIAAATSFVNMGHAGFEPDPDRWPKFSDFLERILGRESFAACISQERKMLRR
jgi:glutathione S-transferase